MAEIPVEKKSSLGWLWILLAVILAALLIWWLLADNDDDTEVVDTTAPVVETDVDTVDTDLSDLDVAGTITSIAALVNLPTLVGNDVSLTGVTVTELAGDMAFYIGEGPDRTLVVFDQTPTPADATEGEYDINPGTRLSLEGDVRAADAPLPTGVDATIPEGTEAYIYADSITMLD